MMAGWVESDVSVEAGPQSERDEFLLDEALLEQLHQGSADAVRALGAVPLRRGDIEGVRFSVWAPNARQVAVVGDFNGWSGERHPMRKRAQAGVWECFIAGVSAGERYKFRITGADGHLLPDKADPMARWAECAPATASRVLDSTAFVWHDAQWMEQRRQWRQAPLSIYEVHAASWQRDEQGEVLDWQALGDRLIPHVQSLGFTHLELLPVSEHPFGGSWG